MEESKGTHPYHAIVFGASGLAGWAVVDQLLSDYPSKGVFGKVTALTSRPLSVEQSFWHSASTESPKLQLVSGVDLTQGTAEECAEALRSKTRDVETISHVFYFAYKQDLMNPDVEIEVNSKMMDRAIGAIERLSTNLEYFALVTGTKAYGVHLGGGFFDPPFRETMPRLPEPHASRLFYYKFVDMLDEMSKGKIWKWCEVRPDAIIGFTPQTSTFNLAVHWGTYLSLYRHIEGAGAHVPFPGPETAYNASFNEASAAMIAKLSIWASVHPTKTAGQAFNVADSASPSPMSDRWAEICEYFGLVGTGPATTTAMAPKDYLEKHKDVLDRLRREHQQQMGTSNDTEKGPVAFNVASLDPYSQYVTFDRQVSLDKARQAGFTEEIEPKQSWYRVFERYKEMGIIV